MRQNVSFLKLAGIGVFILVLILVAVFMLLKNKKTTDPTSQSLTDNQTTEQTSSTTDSQTSQQTDTPTYESPTSSPVSTILDNPAEIKSQFLNFETQGYQYAKKWKSNVSLCAVSIKIAGDLNPQSITYSFVYCTPQEKNYYFNINFNTEGQFLRALVWQTDYLQPNLPLINFDSFKKADLIDALELVESNGGQIFRNTNPQSLITLNLYRSGDKKHLYWFIKYESQDGLDQLNKKIDAFSKQIVSE